MMKLIHQPTGFKARLLLTHSVTLGKSFLLGKWERGSGPNSLSVPFKLTFCDLYQQLLPCHSSLALDCGLRRPGPPCPWLPSKQSVSRKDWWAEAGRATGGSERWLSRSGRGRRGRPQRREGAAGGSPTAPEQRSPFPPSEVILL